MTDNDDDHDLFIFFSEDAFISFLFSLSQRKEGRTFRRLRERRLKRENKRGQQQLEEWSKWEQETTKLTESLWYLCSISIGEWEEEGGEEEDCSFLRNVFELRLESLPLLLLF